jgi:hypothetical protein
MKRKKKKSNVITAYQYKGYTIYICDHSEGYYASIADADGEYVDCSPYRNDIPSVKECAENTIDQL